MKIYLIFLTSLLLLSSCSIDWNDDKEKHIKELESENAQLGEQILELRTTVSSKMKEEQQNSDKQAELEKCINDVTTTYNVGLKQYNLRNNLPEDYPPLGPPGQTMISSREKGTNACVALYK